MLMCLLLTSPSLVVTRTPIQKSGDRITPVVSGTGVSNGVVYLKDVTRSVGTTSAAARGRITGVD